MRCVWARGDFPREFRLMIYPVLFASELRTKDADGVLDEIRYEGRAMAALREDGTWSVRYTDADNHGQTALQGAATWVSVSRNGDTKSRLLFRVGELLESVYVTPQGEFEMSTQATHLHQNITPEGAEVLVHYELFLSGKLVTTNELKVSWSPLSAE